MARRTATSRTSGRCRDEDGEAEADGKQKAAKGAEAPKASQGRKAPRASARREGAEGQGRAGGRGEAAREGRDREPAGAAAAPQEVLRGEGPARADEALRLHEPRCRSRGWRRSSSTWASATRSRTPSCSTRPRPTCGTITGQKPAIRRAKKSIANFKLREGQPIGCDGHPARRAHVGVLDRLVNVAIPRIRDFRGLPPQVVRRPRQLHARRQGADHLPGDQVRQGREDPRHGRDVRDDARRPTRKGTSCCGC